MVLNTKNKNIFKSHHKDQECQYINKMCTQEACVFEKDNHNNLIKYFGSRDVFKWESYIYLTFVTYDFFPLTNCTHSHLLHLTNNMQSLRTVLTKCTLSYSVIFNELLSFVNDFKNKKLVHGNLHINNIFVQQKPFLKFVVVDFANSFVLSNKPKIPMYKRTSFLKEYDSDLKLKFIQYWDFITLYLSLKKFFINNIKALVALDNNIKTYIPIHISEKIVTMI